MLIADTLLFALKIVSYMLDLSNVHLGTLLF